MGVCEKLNLDDWILHIWLNEYMTLCCQVWVGAGAHDITEIYVCCMVGSEGAQ